MEKIVEEEDYENIVIDIGQMLDDNIYYSYLKLDDNTKKKINPLLKAFDVKSKRLMKQGIEEEELLKLTEFKKLKKELKSWKDQKIN